jgi:hypothetical protein
MQPEHDIKQSTPLDDRLPRLTGYYIGHHFSDLQHNHLEVIAIRVPSCASFDGTYFSALIR